MRKLTKEEFILKSNLIHYYEYDYSLVKYINNITKCEIICRAHGPFWQRPNSHINQRSGCPKCYGQTLKKKEQFILETQMIHGGEYDYSKVIYKNNKTKVEIICKLHGSFWQSPYNHINRGSSCTKCSGQILKTKEQFVLESNLSHGNKYDYKDFIYKNARTKGKIICLNHGLFWQTPDNHINGEQSCPKCSTGVSESEIKWLNSINIPDDSEHRQARIYINKFNASGKKKYYVVDRF